MTSPRHFIEIDHFQEKKFRQMACGDIFLSQKVDDGQRVISVLADGLGSGIKAAVLANLTTTMAIKYVASDVDITRAASTIMETLPVCKVRGIAYSTFTIVDMDRQGATRIVEYDNPSFVLLRDGAVLDVPKVTVPIQTSNERDAFLHVSNFVVRPGDRIVIFSDGVIQAGVGQGLSPLGWGIEAVNAYLEQVVKDRPTISGRQLARNLVHRALAQDNFKAKDDISCGVIYYRKPREVLVFTGAPVKKERDGDLSAAALGFEGKKIICGGTTASILSRELGRPLSMDLSDLDPNIPPVSHMDGFELVTEGAITLAALARMLEQEENPDLLRPNAVTRLAGVLLDSDIIHFMVGTKINEALQDPSLPESLDIRRNIIRHLQRTLSERFLKEVHVSFV
ncbi:SpoIIE family protein phosphatase [Holophaga foetida]|uniref:SpoIIE family protein phosphatase n=1 Tax=Holophaga foetida TaxID=35839 RepID=UPI00024721B5|nr:SpoIIE family protein phosphatase [Holophaga foetida]